MKKDVLDFAGSHPANVFWPEGSQPLVEKLAAAVPDDEVPEVPLAYSKDARSKFATVFEVSLQCSKAATRNFPSRRSLRSLH